MRTLHGTVPFREYHYSALLSLFFAISIGVQCKDRSQRIEKTQIDQAAQKKAIVTNLIQQISLSRTSLEYGPRIPTDRMLIL